VGLIGLLVNVCADVHINADNYEYWCVGNCDKDVTTSTTPGIILSGGGTDVDEAFKQQIAWSGGGDFLVLRTSGTDAYNEWVFGLATCNSVATLLLKNRAASSEPFVVRKASAMAALFFAGGDQSTYVTYWTDTPLQDTVRSKVSKGIPVGGTSAGLAILGQWIYTALNDSVTSPQALKDPYDFRITLGSAFIPFGFLRHFITDSHFVTRDRMGRLVAFVARLMADKNGTTVYGIGIDEGTSVLVDQTGLGRVVGLYDSSVAYVIHSDSGPSECQPAQPLTYLNLATFKLQARNKDQYDFVKHAAIGPRSYLISANNGVLPNPY